MFGVFVKEIEVFNIGFGFVVLGSIWWHGLKMFFDICSKRVKNMSQRCEQLSYETFGGIFLGLLGPFASLLVFCFCYCFLLIRRIFFATNFDLDFRIPSSTFFRFWIDFWTRFGIIVAPFSDLFPSRFRTSISQRFLNNCGSDLT